MVKICIFCIFFYSNIFADSFLEISCLNCHKHQQIPSELIYKRYLLKYSTKDRIFKAIYNYIKKPKKNSSIMPAQFFLKFPMKKTNRLNEKDLKRAISKFIDIFDPQKRLRLQK